MNIRASFFIERRNPSSKILIAALTSLSCTAEPFGHVHEGVHSTDDLADKYASGGNDVSVDDELERMKAELGL